MDGNLEIHQNGVRFRPDGPSSKIDILFSNVKHLFFQPSEKELIVLIHFHLKAPIMLGKKKTYVSPTLNVRSELTVSPGRPVLPRGH